MDKLRQRPSEEGGLELAEDVPSDGTATEVGGEEGAWTVMSHPSECLIRVEGQGDVHLGTSLRSHSSWTHRHR